MAYFSSPWPCSTAVLLQSSLLEGTKEEAVARDTTPLVRLTPSARQHVLTWREEWGWRPGQPVLTSRQGDDFVFGVPESGSGHTVEFASLGIALAVPARDADYFRGSVLSCNHDSLYERPIWWLANPNDPLRSGSSDPLGASCCPARLRHLHPELFGLRGQVSSLSADDRDQLIARTSAYLFFGDSRAAGVLQTAPLVVAAYSDEMDMAAGDGERVSLLGGGRPCPRPRARASIQGSLDSHLSLDR
jgi:hypothetical protein